MTFFGRLLATPTLPHRHGQAVLGLSFKTAGTLLKTLEIHTWGQISMFGAVLALRVVLKQPFVWEKGRVEGRRASAPPWAARASRPQP